MSGLPPQDLVAIDFMRRKGFGQCHPLDVDKIEGKPIWYYLFSVPGDPGGTLELEVYWNGQEWETTVCTFKVAN